jgi:hypothetical protein
MSRKANRTRDRQSALDDSDRNVYAATQQRRERSRIGIPRRRRDVPGRPYCLSACPSCGTRIRDLVVAQLGFCDRCRDFTGMCGAGRRIICPDVTTRTTWHTPCTELGTIAWDITQVQGRWRTVLCRAHDTQVRRGGMPWIVAAVPLNPVAAK